MSKQKVYRHGEVVFLEVVEIPTNLKESNTDVFAKGNTGNSHTFKGGKLYPKVDGQYVIGYFKAKNTKLFHSEHSPKGVSLPDGLYEIRRQVEFINGELKVVVD